MCSKAGMQRLECTRWAGFLPAFPTPMSRAQLPKLDLTRCRDLVLTCSVYPGAACCWATPDVGLKSSERACGSWGKLSKHALKARRAKGNSRMHDRGF